MDLAVYSMRYTMLHLLFQMQSQGSKMMVQVLQSPADSMPGNVAQIHGYQLCEHQCATDLAVYSKQ